MDVRPMDRLILAMLADISKALRIKDGVDADLVHNAIYSDQMWALTWEMSGIFGKSESNEVVEETCNILTMWRRLDDALGKLSPDEVKEIKEAVDPFPMRFLGFDGNNDPHYGVLCFMVDHMRNRFSERKPAQNSHSSSSLPRYREMMAVEARYPHSGMEYPGLSKEQLIEIYRAGR